MTALTEAGWIMGIKERREREKKEFREKILAAAEELFARNGYGEVTIRKIAEKIEYSPPTIYEYFKNKADILQHIIYRGNSVLYARLEKVYQRKCDSPLQKLVDMGRVYVQFGLEFPDYYELAFTTNVYRVEKGLNYLDRESQGFRTFDILVATVKECVEAGHFQDKDPLLTSETMWAGLHGVTSLLISHPEFPWTDRNELAENMLGLLVGRGGPHRGQF